MRRWKQWENETKTIEYQYANGMPYAFIKSDLKSENSMKTYGECIHVM